MRLGAVVTVVGRVVRNRPADLLPLYVLGAAVSSIGQVVALLGLAATYAYIEATGRADAVRAELAELDGSPPDPEAEPEAFSEWLLDLLAAFDPAGTPVTGAILAATLVAAVAVVLVAAAVVGAAQLAACFARLRDEPGLVAGVAGARRHWVAFLGLLLLELGLWIAVTVVAVFLGGAGATALVLGSGGAAIGALLLALAVLGWIVAAIAIRATFAFAAVAVVVDRVGVVRSLRNAVDFVRHRPAEAAFYYAVALAAFVGFGALTSILGLVGAGSATALAFSLLVLPALDLLKTALYGGGRGAISPPAPAAGSLRRGLAAGVHRGWRELVAFVRATPGAHAVAVATLAGGVAAGWALAAPLDGVVETSIAARLDGHVPPIAALEFFGNNWTVAFSTAFGGVVLALPALASLWVNGLALGAVGRLEAAPAELLAFVLPHGLFEIPAIVIAGAVGVHLGVDWWRTLRGEATRADLADALERAFWVLVGVGILLAVAAAIEGFVSPYYWRPFL